MAENEVQMIVSGGVRYRPEDAKELKLKADPKPELHADYDCTDDDSGIASCVGTVADGAPFDRSSPGTKTFTVTATDEYTGLRAEDTLTS